MTREIKFRGLGINGDWHHGNLSIIKNKIGVSEPGSYISNGYGMPFAYQIRPESVSQFTSGTDKNRKEIYEGDIVRVMAAKSGSKNRKPLVGIIEFITYGLGHFTVTLVIDGEKWAYGSIDFTSIEVIGNIHENPELIKINP